MLVVRVGVGVVVVGEERVGVRPLWVTPCRVIGLLLKEEQRHDFKMASTDQEMCSETNQNDNVTGSVRSSKIVFLTGNFACVVTSVCQIRNKNNVFIYIKIESFLCLYNNRKIK